MEKNTIIRKLILEQEDQEFYLMEHLQVNDKSVATGNRFQMEEVIAALVHSRKDLITADNRLINNNDCFHFISNKGLRIEKKNESNKENRIKQLEIVISKEFINHENVSTFQGQLKRIAYHTNKKTSYKLIKKTRFVKAVGITTAIAIAGASGAALAYYAYSQQQLQNKQAISNMKQYDIENPTREELQKRYYENQLDYIDLQLQEQVEENKRTRGMR